MNFCARFIPDLATVLEPLRKLPHFSWGKEQEVAFSELKKRLANTQTWGYFDITGETHVITDASPVGFGPILVQEQNGEERVICYTSQSLTDVETLLTDRERGSGDCMGI